MKNFRKVLALVLVVATLFSFAAMASAAKYEDADKISYDMAVDVLSAVGILNGYEVKENTYEFHPTATITREEMAKMIGVMANAGYDVSKLYADAVPFADVSKDRYSASYITYCAKTGIVAGRSATTFDPYGKVTGLETAKMLLVVLGFDAEHQGYVGADWKVNVLRDAKLMGLLNGFAANYNVDTAITREEAAQMMLNALMAPCVVGFISNNHVTITNALTFKDATVNKVPTFKVTNYATLMDALKNGEWALYGNVVISDSLLYKTLFPGLSFSKDVRTADCFGRSMYGYTYTVNGVVKASGSYGLANGKQYTTQVDLATDYAKELKAGYKVHTTINGFYNAAHSSADGVKKYTGNGTDTVVYTTYDADNKQGTIYVNIIDTRVGRVADVDDYKNVFTIEKEDGTDFATNVPMKETVKNGDIVLFRVCDAKQHKALYGNASNCIWNGHSVHDYTVVTPVNVTVDYTQTYTDANKDMLKAEDGKTYNYNKNFNDIFNSNQTKAREGDKKSLYLDKYGYIMLITDVAAAPASVAYFEEGSESKTLWQSNFGGDKYIWNFDAYAADGTAGVIEAGKVVTLDSTSNTLLAKIRYRAETEKRGMLASYKLDGNKHAVLDQFAFFAVEGKQNLINKDTVNLLVNNTDKNVQENVVLTSKTDFIVRTTNAKTGEFTYEEVIGKQNLKETYSVNGLGLNGNAAEGAQYASNVQVLDLDGDKLADYVFIDAQFVSNATEFIVMTDGKKFDATWTGIHALGGDYMVYRALVNGKDSLVAAKKDTVLEKGILYTSALSYQGVVVEENLPLYVVANDAKAIKEDKIITNLEIVEVAEGETYVKFADKDGNWSQAQKGIAKIPVYHIMKVADANEKTGLWIEYNKLNKNLLQGAVRAYVLENAAGEVSAIYVVEQGI